MSKVGVIGLLRECIKTRTMGPNCLFLKVIYRRPLVYVAYEIKNNLVRPKVIELHRNIHISCICFFSKNVTLIKTTALYKKVLPEHKEIQLLRQFDLITKILL